MLVGDLVATSEPTGAAGDFRVCFVGGRYTEKSKFFQYEEIGSRDAKSKTTYLKATN